MADITSPVAYAITYVIPSLSEPWPGNRAFGTDLGSVNAFDHLVSGAGVLVPGSLTRPFISLSCSREGDRLLGGVRGPCSRRTYETVCLSVLFAENALDWEAFVLFTF